MKNNESAPQYFIWSPDNAAHGPVELPALVQWVGERRVTGETWVFNQSSRTWARASEVLELRSAFSALAHHDAGDTATIFSPLVPALRPSNLRRVRDLLTMQIAIGE